jgi:hypothetical protein
MKDLVSKNMQCLGGSVAHTCNPSYKGGSRIRSQPRQTLQETLSQKYLSTKKRWQSQAPVAHACNPSYSGGRDQED